MLKIVNFTKRKISTKPEIDLVEILLFLIHRFLKKNYCFIAFSYFLTYSILTSCLLYTNPF